MHSAALGHESAAAAAAADNQGISKRFACACHCLWHGDGHDVGEK